MSSFSDDFKYVWNKPNNGVVRLIIVNVAVFLLIKIVSLFGTSDVPGIELVTKYLLIPSDALTFLMRPWTIITAFFTHQDFWHIFWNLIIFYWFGQILVEFLGQRKMYVVYFLGGIAGSLAYFIGAQFLNFGYGALGASAAVNAIVVAAATLMPDYRIHLFLIGPVKIKYYALVTVLLSVFAIKYNTGSELAHLGGALMGFVYIMQLKAGNDWGKPLLSIFDWLEGLFKKKPKMKVSYRNKQRPFKNPRHDDTPDQSVIDKILDKIHESGYDKLTEEEKQLLFRASQKNKT